MELSAAHVAFMLATVAAVLGGGIWAARSVNSAEGYSLGGVMLSIVGSAGGLALGIGTMISNDILAKVFSIADDVKKLLLSRLVVLMVAVSACATAIANMETPVLILNYLSMALRGAGIFLPLSLALFRPGRIGPGWVLISMVGSTTGAVLFSTVLEPPIHPLFIGVILSALLMVPGFRR